MEEGFVAIIYGSLLVTTQVLMCCVWEREASKAAESLQEGLPPQTQTGTCSRTELSGAWSPLPDLVQNWVAGSLLHYTEREFRAR